MSQFVARIDKVQINGPYSYRVFKDGAGYKDADNIPDIGTAMSNVQTDIGNALNGQSVTSVQMTVQTA